MRTAPARQSRNSRTLRLGEQAKRLDEDAANLASQAKSLEAERTRLASQRSDFEQDARQRLEAMRAVPEATGKTSPLEPVWRAEEQALHQCEMAEERAALERQRDSLLEWAQRLEEEGARIAVHGQEIESRRAAIQQEWAALEAEKAHRSQPVDLQQRKPIGDDAAMAERGDAALKETQQRPIAQPTSRDGTRGQTTDGPTQPQGESQRAKKLDQSTAKRPGAPRAPLSRGRREPELDSYQLELAQRLARLGCEAPGNLKASDASPGADESCDAQDRTAVSSKRSPKKSPAPAGATRAMLWAVGLAALALLTSLAWWTSLNK